MHDQDILKKATAELTTAVEQCLGIATRKQMCSSLTQVGLAVQDILTEMRQNPDGPEGPEVEGSRLRVYFGLVQTTVEACVDALEHVVEMESMVWDPMNAVKQTLSEVVQDLRRVERRLAA